MVETNGVSGEVELNKWTKQKDGLLRSTRSITVSCLTLPEFVFQNTHKWPDAPFVHCEETGRGYTHGEAYEKSRAFATALINSGLKYQDPVCILLPNVPEYPILHYGILMAGAVVGPINPNFTKDEVVLQVNNCQGRVLITTLQLLPMVESIREFCPTFTGKTIVVNGNLDPNDEYHCFNKMLATIPNDDVLLKGSQVDTKTVNSLLGYSSGTTGPPKSVVHTHASLVYSLTQFAHPEFDPVHYFEPGSQDRFVSVLPFYHIYGIHVILGTALHHGACLYKMNKFEPKKYTEVLTNRKPTQLHLVPPLIQFLVQDENVPSTALEKCRSILFGGAPVGEELMTCFESKFGTHIFFQEAYGMTEITPIHLTPMEIFNSRTGSCGVVTPTTICKIVDVDTGDNLGPNKHGEICYKSGAMMKGYLKNDAATDFTIRDGFVHSGDIGYYDEQGFFYVVDRLKDLIKVKGFQVSPSELENVLRKHPGVTDVAVIGVKHDRFGEAPRAYIIKKNEKLTADDIHTFLQPQLIGYKQLAGGVAFVNFIPKSASGKILKREIVAEYKRQEVNTK